MDKESYKNLPNTIRVREVLVKVQRKGFRPEKFVVVTTLVDAEQYSAEDIAELYRQRWHAELDIRSIKQTLKMDILRGQTPEMLKREIWGHLLGYNLIRQLLAQAAIKAGVKPRHLSFASAVQMHGEFRPQLQTARGKMLVTLTEVLREVIGRFGVGDRPDRREPRRLKRRPKDCKLLTVPRGVARAALLAGMHED
jgi:hypothetical protein